MTPFSKNSIINNGLICNKVKDTTDMIQMKLQFSPIIKFSYDIYIRSKRKYDLNQRSPFVKRVKLVFIK